MQKTERPAVVVGCTCEHDVTTIQYAAIQYHHHSFHRNQPAFIPAEARGWAEIANAITHV
jgi:hypothetical protein